MHILFYDDSAVFGGHQRTAVTAARQILARENRRITYVYHQGASRLRDELQTIAAAGDRLTLVERPEVSRSLQGIRTRLSPRAVLRLAAFVNEVNPDVAVLVQGTIEISSLGLMAASRAAVPTVAYLPWGFSLARMRAPLARLRDRINRAYYRVPDAIITGSSRAAMDMAASGASTTRIHVVPNPAAPPVKPPRLRSDVRREFGIAEDALTIACPGRVHFRHKGQDGLVRALDRYAYDGWLIFVGDGPDLPKLRPLVASSSLRDRTLFVPWTSSMPDYYAAADAVVIPSHYEGTPLVMLEALLQEAPVVAPDIDGMADTLPAQWLFPPGDWNRMMVILDNIKNGDASGISRSLAQRLREECSESRFGDLFDAVLVQHARPTGAVGPGGGTR